LVRERALPATNSPVIAIFIDVTATVRRRVISFFHRYEWQWRNNRAGNSHQPIGLSGIAISPVNS
jgi:hypothetical protein